MTADPIPSRDDSRPPRSIRELAEMAKVEFDPSLSVKSYVRSAAKLHQQAQLYESQHDYELAFVYLVRAAKITIDDLPSQHKDYPFLPQDFKAQIQADGIRYMDALGPLKRKLSDRYSEHLAKAIPGHPQPKNRASGTSTSAASSSSASAGSTLTSSEPYQPKRPSLHTQTSSKSKFPIPSTLAFGKRGHPDSVPIAPSSPQYQTAVRPSTLMGPPTSIPNRQPGGPRRALSSDWEIVDQPLPPSSQTPFTLDRYPPTKPKPKRLLKGLSIGSSQPIPGSSASASTASSRSAVEKSDLTWPVELGNGQGNRMSVALPPTNSAPQYVEKPSVSALIRSAGLQCAHSNPASLTYPPDFRTFVPDPSSGQCLGQPSMDSPIPNHLDIKTHTGNSTSTTNLYSDEAAYRYVDLITSNSTCNQSHPSTGTLLSRNPSSKVYSPQPPRIYNLPGRQASSHDNVNLHHRSLAPPPSFAPESSKLEQVTNGLEAIKLEAYAPRPRRLSWTGLRQKLPSPMTTPQKSTLTKNSAHSPACPVSPIVYERSRKTSLGDPSSWKWLQNVTSHNHHLNLKSSSPASSSSKKKEKKTDFVLVDGFSHRPKPYDFSSPPPSHSPSQTYFNSSHHHQSPRKHSTSAQVYPNTAPPTRCEYFPDSGTGSGLSENRVGQSERSRLHHGHRDSMGLLIEDRGPKSSVTSQISHTRTSTSTSTARPGSVTRRPGPLRQMLCPEDLTGSFMAIAAPETERGVELCGLLLGTLVEGILSINTLLIPKQISTSDTCATTDEDEVFRFQDSRNLLTLGWIHTHPTQTCFMSSLDLHTHASYQLMLPEAIAIVCSPNRQPMVGVFRLTDPPGLQTIVKCKVPGAFHPHPEGVALYTDADQHILMMKDMSLEMVDLRA